MEFGVALENGMPQEHATDTLDILLANLEDYDLNIVNYQALQNALESEDFITQSTIEKLFKILCTQGKKKEYAAHILNIIFSCLKKIKTRQPSTLPDLTPSALLVLNILKSTAFVNKVEALKILCFDVLLFYPDETLQNLTENHKEDVLELIDIFCNRVMPVEIRLQPIIVIAKLLHILTPDKKTAFISDGFKYWFGKVFPAMITVRSNEYAIVNTSTIVENALEALELLVDEVVQLEYAEDCEWQCLLEFICTPKKYPFIMKLLLENGVRYWYRLWIVFVKLLKDQITKCTISNASPINSILTVVEMAFKMDVNNRCKAFLCWDALIDSFSQDTTESVLNRRMKLLVVPLLSNNAKVEDTALAKVKTWWHLIYKCQFIIDNYLEMVLIPFLHFSFGKPSGSVFIPGKISKETEVQCVQIFINITGHVKCNGCVTLPKLNRNLLTGKLFVNYWKDWIFSLNCAIKVCVQEDKKFSERHIECTWKSIIMTVCDLPENSVRKDLFNELIILMDKLIEEHDNSLTDILLCVMIPAFFDNDDKIRWLLKSTDERSAPISKIVTIIMKLQIIDLNIEKVMKSLKLVTHYLVEDACITPVSMNRIECMLNEMSSKDLLLWTALAESFCYHQCNLCHVMLSKMILWPLKHIDTLISIELSQNVWFDLYKFAIQYLEVNKANEDIIKTFLNHSAPDCFVFAVKAAEVMLQQKLERNNDAEFSKEAELLLHISNKMNKAQIISLLPLLIDIIVQMLKNLSENLNTIVAEFLILTFNNILKICSSTFKKQIENDIYFENIVKVLKSLEIILKMEVYSKLKLLIVDQLKNCATFLRQQKSVVDYIFSIYKNDITLSGDVSKSIIEAFNTIDEINTKNKTVNQQDNIKKLNEPGNNLISKKLNMETSIVNIVVDKGEEFVVVKSNWKFNMKKLTDNQKEKLERKREDIPALYQDLSQSQDEFKKKIWKSDSQDTSSISSKSINSTVTEDAALILKDMSKSEFAPRILQNIIIKPKNQNEVSLRENFKNVNENEKIEKEEIDTVKVIKTPRLSLGDRVFRNVRNLNEKACISNELTVVSSNNVDNVLNTPMFNKNKPLTDITELPSSQINKIRPSRAKKIPKKFEDVKLISLKKRKYSVNTIDSNCTTNESSDAAEEANVTKTNIAVTKEVHHSCELETDSSNGRLKLFVNKNNHETLEVSKDKVVIKSPVYTSKTCNIINNNESDTCINNNTSKNDVLKVTKIKEKILQENSPKDLRDIFLENNVKERIEEKSFSKNDNNETLKVCKINNKIKESVKTVKIEEYLQSNDSKRCDVHTSKLNVRDEKIKEIDSLENNNKDELTPAFNCKRNVEENPCFNDIENNSIPTPGIDKTNYKLHCNDILYSHKENKTVEAIQISSLDHTNNNAESAPNVKLDMQKSSNKKSSHRKSRIENQLKIDMVEGHPFLKVQSEKRLTRKTVSQLPNKSSSDAMTSKDSKSIRTKMKKKLSLKESDNCNLIKVTHNTEDVVSSQDVIESSQDSAVTSVSVKSNKPGDNKIPVVVIKPIDVFDRPKDCDLFETEICTDIDLSPNKICTTGLSENMDTDAIDDQYPILTNEDISEVKYSQNTAEADTQDLNTEMFSDIRSRSLEDTRMSLQINSNINDSVEITDNSNMHTSEEITKTMNDSILVQDEKKNASSPYRDEHRRKKDFFNNTLEISPIKTVSPLRENKSPSPETSNDYVVIKLASPVQINGEPFEKGESPEIFIEGNVSPDMRDRSPPRQGVSITNTSPSSSLSLKKVKPQVRSGGRAAQMLGLCVTDKQQMHVPSDKTSNAEEAKRSPSLNTPARRNLKTLYSTSTGENHDNSEEAEERENFLKFKRTLPAVDGSPSGTILKRKLADITDDTTVSPASKRKRVSFHDPPVSTTVCVEKYIEPCGIRSPQSSAIKRLQRQIRVSTAAKSPRRLESVFKLDSALNKTVESFSQMVETPNTDSSSTDQCLDMSECKMNLHVQNDIIVENVEVQTDANELIEGSSQTDLISTTHCSIQTDESGSQSTIDIINNCLSQKGYPTPPPPKLSTTLAFFYTVNACFTPKPEHRQEIDFTKDRPDFIETLCNILDEASKEEVVKNLSFNILHEALLRKLSKSNATDALTRLLSEHKKLDLGSEGTKQALNILHDHFIERFDGKDLIRFCINLLTAVNENMVPV